MLEYNLVGGETPPVADGLFIINKESKPCTVKIFLELVPG